MGRTSKISLHRPDGPALTYLTLLAVGVGLTVFALVLVPQFLAAGGHSPRLIIGLTLLVATALVVLVMGRIPAITVHPLTVITLISANLVISCFEEPALRALTASYHLLIILCLATSLTRRAVVIYGTICVASAVELVLTMPADPALMAVRAGAVAGIVALPIVFFVVLRGELDDALAVARSMATKDTLTGLLNRRGMQEAFPMIASASRRGARAVAVLICDLDHFKRINDSLGHAVGDEVLCQVAITLPRCTRDEDIVVRVGGEEIAVIAAVGDEDEARQLGERLRAAVQKDCAKWSVTMSVGIALAMADSPHGRTLPELLTEADVRLYEAKAAGRNRVCGPGSSRVPARFAG